MKTLNKENIKKFIKNIIDEIDKKIIFISIVFSSIFIYYINPLANVELTEWDRTFSSSIFAGISISKRINNFYLLLLVYIPIIFILCLTIISMLLKYRKEYKQIFFKFSVVSAFTIFFAYVNRFTSYIGTGTNVEFSSSIIFINLVLEFMITLIFISLIDKNKIFFDKDVVTLLGVFIIGSIVINTLVTLKIENISYLIMQIILIIYSLIVTKTKFGQKYVEHTIKFFHLLLWLPAYMYLSIEFLYLLNEKGILVQRHYTNICRAIILYLLVASIIVYLLRKKQISLFKFGAIGLIISLCITAYLPHTYELEYGFESYVSYTNLYEMGNRTVAVDTILKGKIPILENFSAHAISDIWTRIIYCLIHSDIKGILVDPYAFLVNIIEYLVLYFIIKNWFDEDYSLMLICLFPFNVLKIKLVSMYFLIIILLFNILKNKKTKHYFIFWIFTLISALMRYDEGVFLGIACIIAFLIIKAINKEGKEILKFICTGAIVGAIATVICLVYCLINEINVITRIKEWLAVGTGSNSTWATDDLGDPSKIGFLVIYFIFPISALAIFITTIINYIRNRKDINLVAIVLILAIAQILYVPRTIIYHNFSLASIDDNPVVSNFAVCTISFFVLYILRTKKYSNNKQIIGWISTVSIVSLIIGCLIIDKNLNSYENVLVSRAEKMSMKTYISNDMSNIFGKGRIKYSKKTEELVNKFKNVFDELLEDDETFLDFANITSLYMLVDRERPFYVGQSPSLLTNLHSQECYLEEVKKSKVPLAIVGTRVQEYTTHMWWIPHSLRYYTVAEYIYNNYRPLVYLGDFAIWCEKDLWNKYSEELRNKGFFENEYTLIDYGYDFTLVQKDENNNVINELYNPYHKFDLKQIPYIWANYDNYNAIENPVIQKIETDTPYNYYFEGSQSIDKSNGNYLAFKINSDDFSENSATIKFRDTNREGAQYEYQFTVLPGENEYLIRVSQDYFWEHFNINNIIFTDISNFEVSNIRILEGD